MDHLKKYESKKNIKYSKSLEVGDYIPNFVIIDKKLDIQTKAGNYLYLLFININYKLNKLDKLKYNHYVISRNEDKNNNTYYDENIYDKFVKNDNKYNIFFIDKNLKILKKSTFNCINKLLADSENDNRLIRKNMHPPILIVPNVINKELADKLMHYLDNTNHHKDKRGTKVREHTTASKELSDCLDEKLSKSLFPEIEKVFYNKITHRENWKICSYKSEDGGKFHVHRDTIHPYLHRKFAMSLILNDNYQGGGITFPEYTDQIITAPKYSAIIFPGTLYHEVKKINSGIRYVVISFLFTDKEAAIKKVKQYKCEYERDINNIFLNELKPLN